MKFHQKFLRSLRVCQGSVAQMSNGRHRVHMNLYNLIYKSSLGTKQFVISMRVMEIKTSTSKK